MNYKRLENFAFWTGIVGMGIILTSYFMFDNKAYNDISNIVFTIQGLAIIVQLIALYLSVKDSK